jgi:hypothetical protein
MHVMALAVVLAALTAIGCGASEGDRRLTTEEYQEELLDIRSDFTSVFARVVDGDLDQVSPAERAIVWDELGEILNDLAVRLEPLNPPAELTTSHVELAEGLRELGSYLHDVATKIRTLPAVQVEKLVDETFRGGTFDPSRAPAVAKIEDALGELENAVGGGRP